MKHNYFETDLLLQDKQRLAAQVDALRAKNLEQAIRIRHLEELLVIAQSQLPASAIDVASYQEMERAKAFA